MADPLVIPDDQHASYTEKVVYLPHSYMVDDSDLAMAEIPFLHGWKRGFPNPGSCSVVSTLVIKLHRQCSDVWMRLLREIEGSVLWLAGSNPLAMRNLRRSAEMRVVDANRLVFARYTEARELLTVPSARRPLPRHRAIWRAFDGRQRPLGQVYGAERLSVPASQGASPGAF